MDAALKVESRYFAHVLQTKEAAAMIRSLFVSMQELNKGARRPKDEPPRAGEEARRPRRRLHGRRHRLRLGAGRHRGRAPRPRHAVGREGQGAFRRAQRQGDAARRDERGGEGGAARRASSRPPTMPISPAPTSSSRRCSRTAASRPRRRSRPRRCSPTTRSSPPTPRRCRSPRSPRPTRTRKTSSASISSRRSTA